MSGLVRVDSNFTASGTLANLQSALQAANMIVFATFDHADAAKKWDSNCVPQLCLLSVTQRQAPS